MSKRDRDTSFVADALPTFISEAQDQVATIEHLLLRLEETPDDRDLLCNDQRQLLLDAAMAAGGDADDADTAPTRAALIPCLHAAGGGAARAGLKKLDLPTGGTQAHVQRRWNVSVRFGTDLFRNGMDPLALLCHVYELGALTELHQGGNVPNLTPIGEAELDKSVINWLLQEHRPSGRREAGL